MNLFIAILLEAFAGDDDDDEGGEAKEEEAQEQVPPVENGEPPPDALLAAAGKVDQTTEKEPLEGVSLGCLGPDNGLRKLCRDIAEAPVFDTFIILLIIGSSVCLALDVPRLDPTSELKAKLIILNYWFTALFIIEMCLKIIAYDFISAPKAYLRSGWNWLDFIIVMISILGLLASIVPAFGRLKALRILRVLRPLRLLQRNPGMKIIITSLINTLPSVGEVSAVVVVFHIVYAIMGMMMFSGQFGSCTRTSIILRADCFEEMAPPGPPPVAIAPKAAGARLLAQQPLTLAHPLHNRTWAPPLIAALDSPPPLRTFASSPQPLDALDVLEPPSDVVEVGVQTAVAAVAAEAVSDAAAEKRRRLARGRALNARRRQMRKAAWRDPTARAEPRRGRHLKGGGGGGDDEGGEEGPVEWLNPPFGSFDNFGEAMLILYVASTGDAWEEFMWATMDVRGVDVAPERNDFSPNSIFFISWMIVGCFVALNLFVGAIVDNFTRIKAESDGSATMTPEQQQWVSAMKSSSTSPSKGARAPQWGPRKAAFWLIKTNSFDIFTMSVISLNIFGMALEYYRIEDDEPYYTYYHTFMMGFTYFYYCEFVLKFFALGFNYFADSWCQFDFFLVCMAVLDQFFLELLKQYLPIPPTMLRVMRAARVLRLLRLLKNLKGLRDLVMTLVFAFPSLLNIAALLFIVMFMYSVLGMNIFPFVQLGETLNEHDNFQSFFSSMLLLFQCLTGDGWSDLMDDAMINEDRGCDPAPDDGSPSDCGSPLAMPFFISFTIIGTFVFLNLVVAVILENFTALGNADPDLVSALDIADFKEEWTQFDPDADAQMPAKDLPALVMNLKQPLGLKESALLKEAVNPRAAALKFCLALGLRSKGGNVAFKPVLDALIQKSYDRKGVQTGAVDVPALPSPEKMDPATPAGKTAPNPNPTFVVLTPRQREMSSIFAEELLSGYISKRRTQNDGNFSPPKSTSPIKGKSEPQLFANGATPPPACAVAPNATGGSPQRGGASPAKALNPLKTDVAVANAAESSAGSPTGKAKKGPPTNRSGGQPSNRTGSPSPGGRGGKSPGARPKPSGGRGGGAPSASPPTPLPGAAPLPRPRNDGGPTA